MSNDLSFLATVKAQLTSLLPSRTLTWHQHSRDVLLPLLDQLQPATLLTDLHDLSADGLQLSTARASELIRGDKHIPIPIFAKSREHTKSPPPLTIQTLLSSETFKRTESLDVQVSSDAKGSEPRLKTIAEIRKRFVDTYSKPDPWNILGACKPGECPLPAFLDDETCDLLPDVTLRAMEFASRARSDEQENAEELVETWKKALSWVLLAEAGALTTTHQDALGLGTWISCQQGQIGLAWLSRPTEDQTRRWQMDPDHFVDGEWRFKVLRRGETVYFDPGLTHFVFRANGDDQQTLAFGGHTFRRAIAGTCARLLDQHIALITPQDLVTNDTRCTPLPYNESVSYVLRYGLELLEAINEIRSRDPMLASPEENMFQHYHTRLMERFRAFRRLEEAVETASEIHDSYDKHDQDARTEARKQNLLAARQEVATRSDPPLKRPRDDDDNDNDAHNTTSPTASPRDGVWSSMTPRRKHDKAEASIRADRNAKVRSLRQRISPDRPRSSVLPSGRVMEKSVSRQDVVIRGARHDLAGSGIEQTGRKGSITPGVVHGRGGC